MSYIGNSNIFSQTNQNSLHQLPKLPVEINQGFQNKLSNNIYISQQTTKGFLY